MKAATLFLSTLALAALLAIPAIAEAQGMEGAPFECDNNFGECGTPDTSGGGGCGCGCGCSILVANTDLGDTYQYADDYDDDGHEDPFDNCPFASNLDQADVDGDGIGDLCDSCVNVGNVAQADLDGDGLGDLCDDDMDGDGVLNAADNCEMRPNPEQLNADSDVFGNACDDDADGDTVPNLEDNCPLIANPEQQAMTDSGCYLDADNDTIPDHMDNCPMTPNEGLADLDNDGFGDACDQDIDGDNIINAADNCPEVANAEQIDADRDLRGDTCDSHFCYVVYGDEDNCLDPVGSFRVYTPNILANVGEEIKLRLFANRENAALRYTWTIDGAPAGSGSVIQHPYGAVRLSTPYEYHYVQNHIPTLSPDRPGTYRIRLEVTQVWEDSVSPTAEQVAVHEAVIEVSGEAASGCTAAPGAPAAGSALLLLVGLALGITRLRRR